MPEDPKDPKDWLVWWAGKPFPLRVLWKYMHPRRLSSEDRKRLFWVYLLLLILCCIESFYLNKLMK